MVKLVDALDSKSSGLPVRVGSIPTSGTSKNKGLGFELKPFSCVTFSLFLAFLGGISEEVGHNLVANQEVGTAEILAAQGFCKVFSQQEARFSLPLPDGPRFLFALSALQERSRTRQDRRAGEGLEHGMG